MIIIDYASKFMPSEITCGGNNRTGRTRFQSTTYSRTAPHTGIPSKHGVVVTKSESTLQSKYCKVNQSLTIVCLFVCVLTSTQLLAE